VDILVVDILVVDILEMDILVVELAVAALLEQHKTDSYLVEVEVEVGPQLDILPSEEDEDLRNFVAQNLRCLEQNLR